MSFYTTIARYYDAEHQDKTDDLLMYSELAAEYDGPIFEIGCGTGRVMFHLAQAGYEVHGIDLEPAMLDRARARANQMPAINKRLRFIEGDILKYTTDTRYNLVIFPYNGLMHFHDEVAQLQLLRRLRALITADGLLVLDLPNPADSFASQDTDAMVFEKTFLEPESGHLVMQYSVSTLDRTEQIIRINWIYDEVGGDGAVKRTVAPVSFRYFFYSELRHLLRLAGFSVEAVYGSPDLDLYEDGCERMIVFARPDEG
ncbi:MAG: methyltransferase domain-containing protein [Anaerolineae bacterium]|nr:methyltransferase domain-containing protein [Anaerolineae bacterium]MBN8621324.1 methyltransferase domain-containing protein [Anaerolineae bacterium]